MLLAVGLVLPLTIVGTGPAAAAAEPVGTADLRIIADSRTWLGFLAKERNLVWALIRRKIRLKGSPRLLVAFGRCFPS